MADKSEKATPKKLKDSRKKGQVAKSQDFPAAFTFIVAIMGTLMSSSFIYKNLAGFLIQMLTSIRPNVDLSNRLGGFLYHSLEVILITSLPIMAGVSIIGVLINFLIIGPVFSFEAMKFDLKKLNPIDGIKQKFKVKTLVELIKSVLKIVVAAFIIFLVIWNSIPQVMATAGLSPIASSVILDEFLRTITIRVGIFFLIVAVFDLAFQKKIFAKEMKMEKFEVKQEFKDTEGDPQIKGRRRQIAQEMAYQEGPSAAKMARAIITNPVHIAVALAYKEETDPAPYILTMGQGVIAEKIIRIATEEKIPIMRNIQLAQDLFNRGRIKDYIPEDTYKAVAEILKWIAALEENPDFNVELFK